MSSMQNEVQLGPRLPMHSFLKCSLALSLNMCDEETQSQHTWQKRLEWLYCMQDFYGPLSLFRSTRNRTEAHV